MRDGLAVRRVCTKPDALSSACHTTHARTNRGPKTGGGGGLCAQWGQCSNTGPWNAFCCPDGFTCQPGSQNFRVWTCQADVTGRSPVPDKNEVLRFPPRPMPSSACTCRVDGNGERVMTGCPSPWEHTAGTTQVPTPIKVGKMGRFKSTVTGEDVVMHGINW